MQIKANLLILITALVLPLYAQAKDGSPREIKADTIRYLQELREKNVKRLREIDQTLEQKIEVSKPGDVEKDVRALRTTRQEHMLRQEFLDRLIFQVDTKFAGGDLRVFLERALTDMAKVDAVTSAVDNGLWKFLKFAADAVRRLPEQKENIVTFLEGYMNRSISNPIRPDEYLNSRNYTNGAASEAGSPVDREDVGALADRRIKESTQVDEIEVTTPSTAVAPAYEAAPSQPTQAQ